MNVLILSCNTGEGHNSASAAVKEELRRQGFQCVVEDALQFISPGISRMMSWGHTCMYRHVPGLFRWGYGYAERHRSVFQSNSLIYRFFAKGTHQLYEFCEEGSYDAILCTHVFSALMVTDMKKKYPLSASTYFLATDYTCSPSVEQSDLDGYFIPSEELTEEFVKAGIPTEKLITSGIPIREMFYQSVDKREAKLYFGVPTDCRHMVLMCGSMGCGPIKRMVKYLALCMTEEQYLTVVCGTNEKLNRELCGKLKSYPNIQVKGYVQNMSLLLDSADLYITKPGGISVTEASVKKLPMVFIDAVAGCEDYNMHYFMARGCAVRTVPVKELAGLCIALITDQVALQRMTAAYQVFTQKCAGKTVCSIMTDAKKGNRSGEENGVWKEDMEMEEEDTTNCT